jgi:F-type H+-transporting ATPase subunit delta
MSQAATFARPYARALFMLAKEAGVLKDASEALSFSAHAVTFPSVADLLGDPRISPAQLLDLISHPDATDSMTGFLRVLSENGRLALLPEILAQFEALRAENEHVVKATITSAEALSSESLKSLTEALRKRFGREVDVQTAVDASLIGGAIIDAGDIVIDGSVRNKLVRLNASLAN